MPTTGELTGVALGVAAMLICVIIFPVVALACRTLRARDSQLRRWGPANHLMTPPCFCYLTVWVELCPCLEPYVKKYLPPDLTKKHGHAPFIIDKNSPRRRSLKVRPETPNSLTLSTDLLHKDSHLTSSSTDEVIMRDDVITPGSCASPIVQITVASSDTDSRAGSDVLDHGHVNMAMDREESD